MSSQPRSRYPGRRGSRRPSERPSSSDSEDEKLSSGAADESSRRAPSRTRRRREDGSTTGGSRAGGDDRDRYAMVRRSTPDDVRTVELARRRRDPSVASTGTHYEEYDMRSRGGSGDRRREKEKRKSRLDPRVFLAALCCFAGLAFCWDEIIDD